VTRKLSGLCRFVRRFTCAQQNTGVSWWRLLCHNRNDAERLVKTSEKQFRLLAKLLCSQWGHVWYYSLAFLASGDSSVRDLELVYNFLRTAVAPPCRPFCRLAISQPLDESIGQCSTLPFDGFSCAGKGESGKPGSTFLGVARSNPFLAVFTKGRRLVR
jgi:hypothetical protein